MNNMACGVLTVSGTPSIYCVGGSAAGAATATGRVFSYNPVTDTAATLTGEMIGRARWERFYPVDLQWLTTSSTSWAGSIST